ncbi:MAG: hypothetical protein ABIQ41_06175, partial [Gemmatimonadales bacterium]
MSVKFKNRGNGIINDQKFVVFDDVVDDSFLIDVTNATILAKESNHYTINVEFRAFSLNSQGGNATVRLINRSNNMTVLSETISQSGMLGKLKFEGKLTANTDLGIKMEIEGGNARIELSGEASHDQSKYDNSILFGSSLQHDIFVRTHHNVPFLPDGFPFPFNQQYPPGLDYIPWESNVLPWRPAQQHPAGTCPFPNTFIYSKFDAVPKSIQLYVGLDMFTLDPADPRSTIFTKAFEHRGKANYLKKAYMSALTTDHLEYYADKVDTYVKKIYADITTTNKSVLTVFKDSLVEFFLDIHVGRDKYPDYVREYFNGFMDLLGKAAIADEKLVMRGYELSGPVREYLTTLVQKAIDANDTSCIAYHWYRAGFPSEGLLTELVHNMLAFAQFNNTLYKLIVERQHIVDPTNVKNPAPSISPMSYPPLGIQCGTIDFFQKLKDAPTPEDRLNVVREVFRILLPNAQTGSLM